MILKETYELSNGVLIPKLGIGTWLVPNEEAASVVRSAVEIGYNHIDTAQAYENELGVGEGVRTCGHSRDEIFITTKVAAEIKSYDSASCSIDESLERLGVEYLDLVIIHCPQPWAEFRGPKRYFAENKEVWRALEDAYDAGKVRAIGVSNFLIDDLQNILDGCRVRPMVNQIRLHPGCTPLDVIDFCNHNSILVEAYSPIAHGEALKDTKLNEIASKYGVSVPQLCIRYTLQLGTVSLPKSMNPAHIRSNSELDFVITEEDMAALCDIGRSGNSKTL